MGKTRHRTLLPAAAVHLLTVPVVVTLCVAIVLLLGGAFGSGRPWGNLLNVLGLGLIYGTACVSFGVLTCLQISGKHRITLLMRSPDRTRHHVKCDCQDFYVTGPVEFASCAICGVIDVDDATQGEKV